jgi:hypothetical protein
LDSEELEPAEHLTINLTVDRQADELKVSSPSDRAQLDLRSPVAGEKLTVTTRLPEVKELEVMLLCQELGDGVESLPTPSSAA